MAAARRESLTGMLHGTPSQSKHLSNGGDAPPTSCSDCTKFTHGMAKHGMRDQRPDEAIGEA